METRADTPQSSNGNWTGLILWASLIFVSSSAVIFSDQLADFFRAVFRIDPGSFSRFWSVTWWLFVKGWHAIEFAILYLLFRRIWPKRAVAAALVCALLDEIHQVWVPLRGGRLSDVMIDALGIVAAWYLTRPTQRRLPRPWPWVAGIVWLILLFQLSIHPTPAWRLPDQPSQAQTYAP